MRVFEDDDNAGRRDGRVPELVAEWDALSDRLHAMLRQTDSMQCGGEAVPGGETMRLVLDLPKEWAILAAWLELQGLFPSRGEARPLGRDIDPDPRLADWQRAKTYIGRALHNHFHDELHCLCVGAHPYLYPVPPREQRSTLLDLDDDILF